MPRLPGLNEEIQKMDRFQSNMGIATNRNNSIETTLGTAEDLLIRAQELVLSANNGVKSYEDHQAIANELTDLRDEIVALANTTDESGNYLFAGYQVDQQPFEQFPDGSVTYKGDLGERQIQIDNDQNIATSSSGQTTFMDVPNALGDFLPTYDVNTSGIELQEAKVIDRGAYDTTAFPPGYTFTFSDLNADGDIDVEVTDSTGASVHTVNSFTSDSVLQFNGMQVKFRGEPEIGDQITIEEKETVDEFTALNDAIAWIESSDENSGTVLHQIEYNQVLEQLNESFVHLTAQRGNIGNRLSMLDRKDGQMTDFKLTLQDSKQSIEDLDYAAATAEYSQRQLVLQASMQTFQQLSGLSLFNYI